MKKYLLTALVFVCLISVGFVFAAESQAQGQDGDGAQDNSGQAVAVQSGVQTSNTGQEVRIQVQAQNQIRLEVGGVTAECNCEMTQEQTGNTTRLYVSLSNGQNAEVKVMPDTASETALTQLKVRACSDENECQIELKQVGSGEQTKLAYELQTKKQAKVFGLFKAKMQVKAQVNAENGEVIQVKKSWWAFLASEEDETETEE